MRTDLISRIAATLLIIVFLFNDCLASARALTALPSTHAAKAGDYTAFHVDPAATRPPQKREMSHPEATPVHKRVDKQKPTRTPKSKEPAKAPDSRKVLVKADNFRDVARIGAQEGDRINKPADDFFQFTINPGNLLVQQKLFLQFQVKAQGNYGNLTLNTPVSSSMIILDQQVGEEWQKVSVALPDYLEEGGRRLIYFNSSTPYKSFQVKDVQIGVANDQYQRLHTTHLQYQKATPKYSRVVGDSSGVAEIYGLSSMQLPAIPSNIRNVTRNFNGYMLQGIEDPQAAVQVLLDSTKFNHSMAGDIKLVYFDFEKKRWLINDAMVQDNKGEGNTPELSPYFAGLIKTPEMPEASAFNPTKVKDIKAANPAAGMNIMQPPKVSNTGEAALSYPLKIPQGRKGMTPQLALNYSSDGGAGMVGKGWSISMPSVSVETRWGVPPFSSSEETEAYLLNGSDLRMQGEYRANRPQKQGGSFVPVKEPRTTGTGDDGVRFFEKTMNSYKEIRRFGTSPQEYYWVETTADQKKFYYGTTNGFGFSSNHVVADDNGNIAQWLLAKVEDKWGNTINYSYTIQDVGNTSDIRDGGKRVRIDEITYTGFSGTPGKYKVKFGYSDFSGMNNTLRDPRTDLRYGFKLVQDYWVSSIKAYFKTQLVKEFKFKYRNDANSFYETILSEVEEYRSGSFFYEHKFDYHEGSMAFGTPQEIENFKRPGKMTYEDLPGIMSGAGILLPKKFYTEGLAISSNSGWNAGGSIGFGIGPGPSSRAKRWSLSAQMGYNESKSHTHLNLDDMNGDGLPDVVFHSDEGAEFQPLSIGADNQVSFYNYTRRAEFPHKFNKNESSGINYGFDFTTPYDVFYYGLNWNVNKSTTSNYLTDFNSDGIKDAVKDGQIYFGSLKDNGNVKYSVNSDETESPVYYSSSVVENDDDALTKKFEFVKVWRAPFEGTVEIIDTAKIESSVNGIARIAIQHNDNNSQPQTESFIRNFTTVDAGQEVPTIHSDIEVSKGDYLLFRINPGVDGHNDVLDWDPRVNYTSGVSGNTEDVANDFDYGDSKYRKGMLLSGGSGVSVQGNRQFKINWPMPSGIPDFTDDTKFRIKIEVYDEVNATIVAEEELTYTRSAGSSSQINPTNFKDHSTGTPYTPGFLGGAGTISDLASISTNSSDYFVTISFEVNSTSNIQWNEISWRPKVIIGKDLICDPPQKELYPTVYYHTYNRLDRVVNLWSPGLTTTDQYKFKPDITAIQNLTDVFTTDEINAGGTITKEAHLVVKSNKDLVGKYKIDISTSSGTFNLTDLGDRPNSSHLTDDQFQLGIYSEDGLLASYLKGNLTVEAKNTSTATVDNTTNNFDVYYVDRNELQDYLLHWGQFIWSNEADDPIKTSEMKNAYEDKVEEDFDYSSEENDPSREDFQAQDPTTMDPMNLKFFMTVARRGEWKQGLRSYQPDIFDNNKIRDRLTAFNTHMAIFKKKGMVSPGYLGEQENQPSNSTPPANVPTMARAVPLKTKAKYSGETYSAIGVFSKSTTRRDDSKRFSESINQMLDINGDGYPDILDRTSSGNLKIQPTNNLGGHTSQVLYSSNKTLSKTIKDSESESMSTGGYVSKAIGYEPTEDEIAIAVKPSVEKTENITKVSFMDINGDGLADRNVFSSGNMDIQLGDGRQLLSGKAYQQYTTPSSIIGASPISRQNSYLMGAGASFSNIQKFIKGSSMKEGLSIGAGINVNKTTSFASIQKMDLDGNGLVDLITSDESGNYTIWVNTGNGLIKHSTVSGFEKDLNESISVGLSGNISFSFAITTFSILGAHTKLSFQGNGGANFSTTRSMSALKDMNGDGLADFVYIDDNNGKLMMRENLMQRQNLLKRVTNPLGVDFEIGYKRVGNKVGPQKVKIETHLVGRHDRILWDMPSSKWVMSEVKIRDGFNIEDNHEEDFDGSDHITYSYKYDGGIKNRYERKFLGFTRVGKYFPMHESSVDDKVNRLYTVTEYETVNNLEPESKRKLFYLQGLVKNQLKLYDEYYDDPNNIGQTLRDIHLISKSRNKYEFRKVKMAPGSYFNRVHDLAANPGSPQWEIVSWNAISHAACIFPAVIKESTIVVPQINSPGKKQIVEYDLKYDQYTNVVEYSNKAYNYSGSLQTQVVSSINYNKIDVYRQNNNWMLLLADGFEGFDPDGSVVIDGQGKWLSAIIPSDSASVGYGADTIYTFEYEILGRAQQCSEDPWELGEYFHTYHVRQTQHTSTITEEVLPTGTNARILAKMTYWAPGSAANRTNALKDHKVYLEQVSPGSLRRHTEVTSLNTAAVAPKVIRHHIDNVNNKYGDTELSYSTEGNVTQIKGPANHQSQRLTVDYTYDTEVKQFVESISNSYGDNICNKYDYATGLLLKTEDVNGFPMQYEYDEFYRMEEVWGPKELDNTGHAPTISFEYYPEGKPGGSGLLESIPVAVTNHNLKVESTVYENGTTDPTEEPLPGGIENSVNCASLVDVSGRPAITKPMQTATFMDGMKRVIQVKKDVAYAETGESVNIEYRQVSGMKMMDRFGQDSAQFESWLEDPANWHLLKLNNTNSAETEIISEWRYDYQNRQSSYEWKDESGHYQVVGYEYDWDANHGISGNSSVMFYKKTNASNVITKEYRNKYGQLEAKVQVDPDPFGTNSVTEFEYDGLNQLTRTIDPEDQPTNYQHDMLGRVIKETHPDRGTTYNTYDNAGNLRKIEKDGGSGIHTTISMEYNYNRLDKKEMPRTNGVSTVEYQYGSLNDGYNGAGRVTRIRTGFDGTGNHTEYLEEKITYDEMGNVHLEEKTIAIPMVGKRTFTTSYYYDSWGRLLLMSYPNRERVKYTYFEDGAGELLSIEADGIGYQTTSILENQLYDGFNNLTTQEMGNGTKSEFTYWDNTRKLKDQDLTSGSNTLLLNKTYEYDKRGNVFRVTNNLGSPTGLGDYYKVTHTYDHANRLKKSDALYGSNVQEAYQLNMNYHLDGRIDIKDHQVPSSVSEFPAYNSNYTYSSNNPHQLSSVNDGNGNTDNFVYNNEGSVKRVYGGITGTDTSNVRVYDWDEEQKLRGAHNANGIHHYLYDDKGQRLMKGSMYRNGVVINAEESSDPSFRAEPYTVYVNPYYIITHYNGNAQTTDYAQITKHYYKGSQRLAAQLEGEHGNSNQITSMTDNPVEQDGIDLLEGFGQEENVDFIPSDLYSDENLYADWVMTEEEYNLAIDEIHGEGNPPTEYSPCFVSQFYPYMLDETDCNYAGVIYYYHPDYLGNVEYITDRDGEPYQYFHYSAFGEAVVENKANTGTHVDYFRFNGKELDPETGNYYYGARYYDPRLSVWLSVDPLAHKYPGLTPYNFVANNPVMLVDPDGRIIEFSEKTTFVNKVRFLIKQWHLNIKSKTARSNWKKLKEKESGNVHTVHVNEKNANGELLDSETVVKGGIDNQNGNGTDIYINLQDNKIEGKDIPIEITIGHEEGHALRFDQGLVKKIPKGSSISGSEILKKVDARRIAEEKAASHIENRIRAEYDPNQSNFGLRKSYNVDLWYDPISGGVNPHTKSINVIREGYDYYK